MCATDERTWRPEGPEGEESCRSRPPPALKSTGGPKGVPPAHSRCWVVPASVSAPLGPSAPTAQSLKLQVLTGATRLPPNPAPAPSNLLSAGSLHPRPWPFGYSSKSPGLWPTQGLCTCHFIGLGLLHPDLPGLAPFLTQMSSPAKGPSMTTPMWQQSRLLLTAGAQMGGPSAAHLSATETRESCDFSIHLRALEIAGSSYPPPPLPHRSLTVVSTYTPMSKEPPPPAAVTMDP